MKRRDFIKGVAAVGGTALLPASSLSVLSSCSNHEADKALSWDFDEVIDRSGTFSIKHGRGEADQLKMWIADMDFKTDPYVAKALSDRLSVDAFGYTSIPKEFYSAIKGWLLSQHAWDVPTEWISYAPGVITSLNQAYLTFTKPGDKIIVQPPVYDHFKQYIERLGRITVDNPLILENGKYRMDFESLESLIDEGAKVLVLCNPQNPGGVMWDRETLSRLAEICCRKGVLIFSDEIHCDLALCGRRHIPFCSVSEDAKKIGLMFSGPTKTFNLAGMTYTAYSVIPNESLREQYNRNLSNQKLNEAPIMTIVATIAAFTHDTAWLEDLKKYIQGNVECVSDFFSQNDLGIKVMQPEASFLIWLDCRSLGMNQKDLMAFFSDKARLVLSNGESYGMGGEGFVRLNIGCSRSVLKDALQRIKSAFEA